MSNHITQKILLVGASQMSIDYFKVLKQMNLDVVVVGRGDANAEKYREITGVKPVTGGVKNYLERNTQSFDKAIVAVGTELLAETTLCLLEAGIKDILVEKPGGLNEAQIAKVNRIREEKQGEIFVAYNRRFYASVKRAAEIIEQDGGVTSFNFEFTEWSHKIEPLTKALGVKENWLLANSTHVIDLAFYLGGWPVEMSSYSSGELSWHKRSIFSGAGISENGALFSYQANWQAPGRWGVEWLTAKHRLILRPLETLQIQELGSVVIKEVEIDDSLDKEFKPGLYRQTEVFVSGNYKELYPLEKQLKALNYFEKIRGF